MSAARSSLLFEEVVEAAVCRALARELAPFKEVLASLASRLPRRLLTVREAAKELGVHERTIRRHVANRELAHEYVGHSLRIDIDASRPLVGGER